MQAVAGIGIKLMVHLERRNIDQENKRIETGCKGRFACVKPFCFTSFLSNYLILGKTFLFLESERLIGGKEASMLKEEQLSSERQ